MTYNRFVCFLVVSLLTALSFCWLSAQDGGTAPPAAREMTDRRAAIQAAQQQHRAAWANLRTAGATPSRPDTSAASPSPALPTEDVRVARAQVQKAWTEFAAKHRPKASPANAQSAEGDELPVPEEIRSQGGHLHAALHVVKARNQIGGDPVYLRSYNYALTGPTLRARPGDTLHVTLHNDLDPETDFLGGTFDTLNQFNITNLHFHGLHVSPAGISDNVFLQIGPQAKQDYEIAIPKDHPAGTFWYHGHRHGSTAAQVSSGMSGALIIDGGMDAELHPKGIDKHHEKLLIFQQIAYLYGTVQPPTGPPVNLPEGIIEDIYQGLNFVPNSWDKLGRYTTINGAKQPIIHLRPGSIQRWRMIDSGIREEILLRLVRADGNAGIDAPATLTFNEIAEDGLPLGKVVPHDTIDLWPGYRSDVLVQAPNTPGAEYILHDERPETPTAAGGFPITEDRRIVAHIIIDGEPEPMTLPDNTPQLASYRLPTLVGKPAGAQYSAFGIDFKVSGNPASGVQFTVADAPTATPAPYDGNTARQLHLNDVDEWTLVSKNDVGAVTHPFHIHVNPFEVLSMKDPGGQEHLTEPVWKDTLILQQGWTNIVRMNYRDYVGTFVTHCHILDHEDSGMMEMIEVEAPAGGTASTTAESKEPIRLASAYAAPEWELPDAYGHHKKLADFAGKPTVLFFFEKYSCYRCAKQIAAYTAKAEEFKAKGIQLVAISSGHADEVRKAQAETPTPFPVLVDESNDVFKRYGCFACAPMHGTFLLDASGRVCWQAVSMTPFDDLNEIESQAVRLVAEQPAAVAKN